MPSSTKRRTNPDTSLAASEAEIVELAASLHGRRDCDALLDLSFKLMRQCNDSKEKIEQLRELQGALKAKCEAVTAPAHLQVIITAMSENGQLMVEVAAHGGGTTRVAVDPDIDVESLRIGAIGWVTSDRNCLIGVSENDGCWRDVAQFEDYLDQGSRMLLKERDRFVVAGVADRLKSVELHKGDLVGYDREVRLAFQRVESPDKRHLFDENISGSFCDLVGLEKPITLIQDLIGFRFLHSDIAAAYDLPDRHGILFLGPPGNGKTHLARCVASYLKELHPDQPCRFMHVAGSADYSMWLGESEQKIIERFAAAREAARSGSVVLFFDEVEAIGRARGSDHGSGAPDRILSTFLSQLDGVLQHSGIIVMAATNRPDALDTALTRPGRFDYKIELGKPNRRTASAILRHYLGNGRPLAGSCVESNELVAPMLSRLFAPNGQYAEIACVKLRDGRRISVPGRELLSGAMLKNVVNVAAWQAALRESQTGERGIREDDLLSAMEGEILAGVSLLTPANVFSYVSSIPRDTQIIDVEVTATAASPVRYLRP